MKKKMKMNSVRIGFSFFQRTSINDCSSSFNRCGHNSLSRGPAFVLRRGICVNDLRVAASTMIEYMINRENNDKH